jgi:DNA-binding MarR family transcriptional regulator
LVDDDTFKNDHFLACLNQRDLARLTWYQKPAISKNVDSLGEFWIAFTK